MPLTMRQHETNLHQPALCELLPIRDYLDNLIVRSNGALVAGYDLGGILQAEAAWALSGAGETVQRRARGGR